MSKFHVMISEAKRFKIAKLGTQKDIDGIVDTVSGDCAPMAMQDIEKHIDELNQKHSFCGFSHDAFVYEIVNE